MANNKAALDKGFKKFQKLKMRAFSIGAINIADKICEHIKEAGTYWNVTGNTRGSIAFGVYVNGSLALVDTPYDRMFTRRRTLVGGEYDKETGFRAPKDSNSYVHYYGFQASEEFLHSYNPKNNKGISVVFVVGTHYADYLESVRGHNVLTSTYEAFETSGESAISKLFWSNAIDSLGVGDVTQIELPF